MILSTKIFNQRYLSLIILFFFLSIELFSQKAIDYYALLAKAEESFVNNNLDSSLIFYDSAFVKFDYPFYRNIRQATIIASYSNNNKIYHKFLKKCIQRGMTKNELDFFIKRTPNDDFVKNLYADYDKYRERFIASIDTFMLFNYLEVDMIEQIAMEDYGYDSIMFHTTMKKAAQIYMSNVDSLGFPDEKKLGLCYFTFISKTGKKDPDANWYQIKLRYHKKEAGLGLPLYGSINIENLTDKPYSMKPGNWFISHYHIENYIIDTTFYNYLKRGLNELKIYPITLALFLERTGIDKYDFLMTYYSPLYLKMKMKIKKALSVDKKTREKINKNRKVIFVRPIEREVAIVKEFYKLKYDKYPKKINKRVLRKIHYEINSFINYI